VYSETYDGTSYVGCKKYEDVQTILNDRIIGEELVGYSVNSLNVNTDQIGETENRIQQTKCFGLNHNATLYSSEGYQIEYVNSVNI